MSPGEVIPICVGMPRSASRMTWQIVKSLCPPEPEWWKSAMTAPATRGRGHRTWLETMPWPARTHNHMEGNDPVIYTYRDPVEAYLSLKSRFANIRPDFRAIQEILDQRDVYGLLKFDVEKRGRSVLFLRYEDYFNNDRMRLHAILEFMNRYVSYEEQEIILKNVSLQSNMAKSKCYAGLVDELDAFLKWEDPESGMQGNHINETILGKPGEHLKAQRMEHLLILEASPASELGRLREFAVELGY